LVSKILNPGSYAQDYTLEIGDLFFICFRRPSRCGFVEDRIYLV
jgi:hypothetical protein